MRELIIAIDGPAGAGKTTVARELAKELNYMYVDTGAMYRAVTWKILKEKVPLNDEQSINKVIQETDLQMKNGRFFIDGEDVTDHLRTPEVTKHVSPLSQNPLMRERLISLQRQIGERGGVTMEGRDIGSVVFPDADLKIFLDATLDERARRRKKELEETGFNVDFQKIKMDIKERDERDSKRSSSPLIKTEDAIYIDTTDLSIREVVERIKKEIDFLRKEKKVNVLYRFLEITLIPLLKTVFKFKVKGSENIPPTGGVLILSNHVSYIDPIVVGAGCRRRVNFMAKSELFKIPIFGYIIKKLYAFPVRRGGFGKDAFKKALELLNNKEVLLIFPEGQRSKDGKLLSGKSGIGWIVAKAIKQNKHLKIIPARIIGSDKVLPVGSKFIRISPLEIRFGRSIKFEDLLEKFEEDPKRLYHLITERVMEKIKEL